MITPRLNIAMYVRHGGTQPPSVSSCVSSSNRLNLCHLSDNTSGLLRATLLPPVMLNHDEHALISHSRRPKFLSQFNQNRLCGLNSYLGFDSGMKKQSLFVTIKLIYLREFIPNQSVFFNTLTIIRYRDNYGIQRLHACLGSSGFALFKSFNQSFW